MHLPLALLGWILVATGTVVVGMTQPKWVLAICALLALILFQAMPYLVGKVLDPVYLRAVRAHLEQLHATDIDVKLHKHHIGARFTFRGERFYARCEPLTRRRLNWLDKSPEELIAALDVA